MNDTLLRNPLLLLGGLGLTLVLAAFLLFGPLRSGGTGAVEPAAESLPPAAPAPETAIVASPSPPAPAEAETEGARETFQVFSARDPFQQLVVASAVEAVPPAAAPGSTPAPGASPPPSPSAPEVRVGGTTIELVDTFQEDGQPKALVTVNGTGYEVVQGETFAQSVKLLAIDEPCATLLFGDSRFTACEGEQVRK